MTNCTDYILLMKNTFGKEKYKKNTKILKHVFASGFPQQNGILKEKLQENYKFIVVNFLLSIFIFQKLFLIFSCFKGVLRELNFVNGKFTILYAD